MQNTRPGYTSAEKEKKWFHVNSECGGKISQCGDLTIFLLFWFYVKSSLEGLEVQKMPFLADAPNFFLEQFQQKKKKIITLKNQSIKMC